MAAQSRYLLASVAVVAVTALVAVGLLVWQDGRLAAATAGSHLDTVDAAQQLVESQDARDLSTRAELIAGNQAVIGYVTQALGSALPGTTIDRGSIVDLLEERRDQLGLAVAAVLDSTGKLVASTDRTARVTDFSNDPLFVAASKAQALRTGLLLDGPRLLHIAILPLAAYGSGDAYLLIGIPVGDPYARTIARISDTDVALVATTPKGRVVVASTLPANDHAAVLASLPAKIGADVQRVRLNVDGTTMAGSMSTLLGSGQAQLVGLVAAGRDVSAFTALRLPMAIGCALALLLVALATWLFWSRVLGPLAQLGGVMERAADQGDFRLTAPERGLEAVKRLAAAFNRLLAQLS